MSVQPADLDYILDRMAAGHWPRVSSDVAKAIQARIKELEAELRASQAREWTPSPGHWYVEEHPGGRSMTLVGQIEDIDQARLRVALQRAHDAACEGVLAAYRVRMWCEKAREHLDHPGPCGYFPSPSAVVMAVLDTVGEALAHPTERPYDVTQT